jgi:hypothetical protein
MGDSARARAVFDDVRAGIIEVDFAVAPLFDFCDPFQSGTLVEA